MCNFVEEVFQITLDLANFDLQRGGSSVVPLYSLESDVKKITTMGVWIQACDGVGVLSCSPISVLDC
jgi:hypothetical protein